MSLVFLVPSFSLGRKRLHISSHGGLLSRRRGARPLKCFSVGSLSDSGMFCGATPLPHCPHPQALAPPTLGRPIPAPFQARHNGALAAPPPEPATEGLPRRAKSFPLHLPGEEGGVWREYGSGAGARAPGAGAPGCWGCRVERRPGKPRTAGLPEALRVPEGRGGGGATARQTPPFGGPARGAMPGVSMVIINKLQLP